MADVKIAWCVYSTSADENNCEMMNENESTIGEYNTIVMPTRIA